MADHQAHSDKKARKAEDRRERKARAASGGKRRLFARASERSAAVATAPSPYPTGRVLAGYRQETSRRGLRIALLVALGLICVAWGAFFALGAPYRIMPLIAPLPVLLLLAVWVLPEGEYAPIKAIEPLFLAFFAALVLWPNYIAVALPHLPWVTMLRMFAAPLVLVVLISISVSAKFRSTLAASLNAAPIVWRMLAAFVILQTVSLVFSSRPAISLNRYIVDQLHHTMIFIVSCYVFLTPGFGERWMRMFLAMLYVVCGIGLWEGAIHVLPWASHIPSFLKIETDLVANILDGAMRAAVGEHRVQAMTSQPLVMAELLGLGTPFAIHAAVGRYPLIMRVAGMVYVPLSMVLIELADSRLGYVAVLSAVLFYLLIWGSLRWRQNQRSLMAPALVLAYPLILVTTLLATFFVGRIRNAVWGTGAQSASNDAREVQWQLAMPKVMTHPLGHGLGEAGKTVGYVSPAGKPTLDSYYITILVDFGFLGFLLFFGMFLYAAWVGSGTLVKRGVRGELGLLLPFTVALLQFVVIKSVLSQDSNHPLVFMILGAIMAFVYRAQQASGSAKASPQPAPTGKVR